MEASTGDILYAKNPDQHRAIASTTKLMTAYVALQRDDLDDVFSAAAYHASTAESLIGLRAGERMSVRDLLRAACCRAPTTRPRRSRSGRWARRRRSSPR